MKTIKIGFLGFGNVGTGAYRIIEDNAMQILHKEGLRLTVEKILVKDLSKKRNIDIDASKFTTQIQDILSNPEISIVAEFLGGTEPARQYILAALENKKTVVTANKEVMAKYWQELEKVARTNGVGLYYEASVAGGIPIIKMINESLQANRVTEIMGIINGTTNFVLTKMSDQGREYQDVLAEAQRLGYAEPDPTADVEGHDAMYKLSILASLAFHGRVHLDHIYREGITRISKDDILYGKELGYVLKLLAIAKRKGNQFEARVHPTLIPKDHPLAAVRDSYNAIFVKGDAVGNLMLYGRGAGDLPTGSAVVSDIIIAGVNLDRHRYTTFFNEAHTSPEMTFHDNWETEFFVRLTAKDRPGVLAKISSVFARYGVSIASLIQKDKSGEDATIIFVTHHVHEKSMQQAMNEIREINDVAQVDNVIRVER